MRALSLPLFALTLGLSLPVVSPVAATCNTAGDTVVATIDGAAVTHAELNAAVADQIVQLDVQRQQILEAGLAQLVDNRLLDLAAASRSTSVEALVATELAAADPVTDDDVEAFYNSNRARIQQPKEAAMPRLRQYLEQQRSQTAREGLLDSLRADHEIELLLDPMRVEVKPDASPFRGASKAPVDVMVFSDFQCPFCSRIEPTLDQLREHYGDRVRVTFRQFPLTNIHPEAFQAAEASFCAQDQGKFWPMHGALFANNTALGREDLSRYAAEIGLDVDAFDRCVDSRAHQATVEADIEAGRKAGVAGTPTLFINGRPVTLRRGVEPFKVLSSMVDDELRRHRRMTK